MQFGYVMLSSRKRTTALERLENGIRGITLRQTRARLWRSAEHY
jgi:hypothetical protein